MSDHSQTWLSLGIALPKSFIDEYGIDRGDDVFVTYCTGPRIAILSEDVTINDKLDADTLTTELDNFVKILNQKRDSGELSLRKAPYTIYGKQSWYC